MAQDEGFPHDIRTDRVHPAGIAHQGLRQVGDDSIGPGDRGEELHRRPLFADQGACRCAVGAALQRDAGDEVHHHRSRGVCVDPLGDRPPDEAARLAQGDSLGEDGVAERQRLGYPGLDTHEAGHQQVQGFGFPRGGAQAAVEVKVLAGRRHHRSGLAQDPGGEVDGLPQQRVPRRHRVQRRQTDRFGRRQQVLWPASGQPAGAGHLRPPAERHVGVAFQQQHAQAAFIWDGYAAGQFLQPGTEDAGGRGGVVHHDQRIPAPMPRLRAVGVVETLHLRLGREAGGPARGLRPLAELDAEPRLAGAAGANQAAKRDGARIGQPRVQRREVGGSADKIGRP